MIKTVVAMKGAKRFKNKGAGVGEDLVLQDELDKGNIKDYFRKKMTQTSYCANFGDKPKAAEAYSILKHKTFN